MLAKRTDLMKKMSQDLEALINGLSEGISSIDDDFGQDLRLNHLHCIEQQIGSIFTSVSSAEDDSYQVEMSKGQMTFLLSFITDCLDLLRMGSSAQCMLDKHVLKTESFVNDLIGKKDNDKRDSCHDLVCTGREKDLQAMVATGITHRVASGDHAATQNIAKMIVRRISMAYEGNHLVSALNNVSSDLKERSVDISHSQPVTAARVMIVKNNEIRSSSTLKKVSCVKSIIEDKVDSASNTAIDAISNVVSLFAS